MKKENTALIIVDPQEGFENYFNKKEFNEMIENNLTLIEYAKKQNMPIYNFKAAGFGETDSRIKHSIMKYKKGKTLTKKLEVDGCFTNKKLNEGLSDQEIEYLIITGLNGPYCPKNTAIMAKQKNYEIYSAEGLIISNEKENMQDFESWFYREGNYYDSTQELIDNIE